MTSPKWRNPLSTLCLLIFSLALVSSMDVSRGARRIRSAVNAQLFTLPLFTTKAKQTVSEVKSAISTQSNNALKTSPTTAITKKLAALIMTPPTFKSAMPWAVKAASTTTAKPTTTSTTKAATTTAFDFDTFLEKEEAEISSSQGKPAKLGLNPSKDADLIEDEAAPSAPSGGGLSGLMNSAGKLFSGLGLPGFGGKKAPEKKSEDDEASDSDGADGEGDAASEDESAEAALAIPKKLDLGSLFKNANDLIAPNLKMLGGGTGGGNPLTGLLGSFGNIFGGGKAAAAATTETSGTTDAASIE